MKELNKAILNADVERIVFLLEQKVDCECAVLMHLKEKLVPQYFSEEELRARGAIMDLADLDAAIERYTQMGFSEEPVDTYRMDFYVKRLYFSAQEALKMWRNGAFANQEVDNAWNSEALNYLGSKWIVHDLPKVFQDYAQGKQDAYIEAEYRKWVAQSLDAETSRELDDLLLVTLRNHWHLGDEFADPVCRQIRSNLMGEAVELCRNNTDEEFTKDVIAFIRGKVIEQIYNSSINQESIRNVLEEEAARILQGKMVANPVHYYEQAILNIFAKWQKGELDVHSNDDVSGYIRKQLLSYPLSGQLKSELLERAIPHLLAQYRSGVLPAEVMEQLTLQFKNNIVGHYEKDASKDTPFRHELSQVIFLSLLEDWKAQQLDGESSKYLQTHLLAGLQETVQEFGLPTSRFMLCVMVKRLENRVAQLEHELGELKASKLSTPVAQVSDDKTKESEVSLAVAAQQHGVFRPVQPANSLLFIDAVVIPKQPQGPGPK